MLQSHYSWRCSLSSKSKQNDLTKFRFSTIFSSSLEETCRMLIISWIAPLQPPLLIIAIPERSKVTRIKGSEYTKVTCCRCNKACNLDVSISCFILPVKGAYLRFRTNYRFLNNATAKRTYPTLRIEECTDALDLAKLFSTFDANSGHWQIPVNFSARLR